MTITSMSQSAADGRSVATCTVARGRSCSISFLIWSSFAVSGETSHSSSEARASSRAQAAADRTGGADDHRLAPDGAVVVDLGDPEPAHRLVGGPQRARGAVAVAGGDRERRLLGDGDAGVADDLGECAQPHDLGAEPAGQIGGFQQAGVGELGWVGEHLLRGAADGDQPSLHLVAGVGHDAGDVAVHERRHVGHGLLHHPAHAGNAREHPERLEVLEVLGGERVDDEREPALAPLPVRPDEPRLDLGVLDEPGEVVGGELGAGGEGRGGHRLVHRGDDHELEGLGGDVDDEVGAQLGERGEPVVGDRAGDDRLAARGRAGRSASGPRRSP